MPKVIITGANGFLGSYLVEYFTARKWEVVALVHHMPQSPTPGVEYKLFDLARISKKDFPTGDCLIHCAYVKNSLKLNKDGTENMLRLSRGFGIPKHIFISTISASANATSVYVKQKWKCEELFNSVNDIIIRPGLILGNGGLFGQMRDYLKTKSLIPLINGGKQPLQTIYIGDLADVIYASIEKNITGTYTLASPENISYRRFYEQLCRTLNKKPTFISIPYGVLYLILSISETLGIKLAVTRENLRGLKQLHYVDTTNGLKKLEVSLKSCAEALKLLSLKS